MVGDQLLETGVECNDCPDLGLMLVFDGGQFGAQVELGAHLVKVCGSLLDVAAALEPFELGAGLAELGVSDLGPSDELGVVVGSSSEVALKPPDERCEIIGSSLAVAALFEQGGEGGRSLECCGQRTLVEFVDWADAGRNERLINPIMELGSSIRGGLQPFVLLGERSSGPDHRDRGPGSVDALEIAIVLGLRGSVLIELLLNLGATSQSCTQVDGPLVGSAKRMAPPSSVIS